MIAMKCEVNWAVFPLKLILFLTFAATSGLLPYLNIHMKQLGFTIHETAIICCLIPLCHLFTFSLIKTLSNKLNSSRTVLMHALPLAIICASLLLAIPELPLPEHRHHSLHLVCGPDIKPRVIVDKCGVSRSCNKVEHDDVIYLQFSACSVQCPDHGIDMREPVNVADLCFDDEFGRICHVVEVNNTISDNFTFGLYLNSPEDRNSDCHYPVEAVTWHQLVYHRMSCPIIIRHLNKGNCSLKCRFQEVYDVAATLSFDREECVYVSYKRWLFLALYFLVRWTLHNLIAIILMLLQNSLSVVTRMNSGRYTAVDICNFFATAALPPLVGIIIDVNSSQQIDYGYAIYAFDILLGAVMVLVVVLDVPIFAPNSNNLKNFRELSCKTEYTLLLIVKFWMGVIWGYIEIFLFWYLLEFDTPKYVMGLTITVGSLTGLPFLRKSRLIVRKVGCVNILCLALLMYCGRCIGYSLITNGWWSVLLSVTDLLTYHLMSVATSSYCDYIIPKELVRSAEALIKMTHYSLGRSAGGIIGGGVMGVFGAHITLRVLGASGGILGLLYMCLFYACIFNKSKDGESYSKTENQVWEISEDDILSEESFLKDNGSGKRNGMTPEIEVITEWVQEITTSDKESVGVLQDTGCHAFNKSRENRNRDNLDEMVVIVHEENKM